MLRYAMRCGVGLGWSAALAAAFACAFLGGQAVERRLVIEPSDGMVLYAQSSLDEDRPSNGATQRITRGADGFVASYTFTNFNRDRLTIDYRLAKGAFQA